MNACCSRSVFPALLFAFVPPVLVQVQCFCAKNWYSTQSCRINGEPHTRFPFDCSLSHVLRARRLQRAGGLRVEPAGGPGEEGGGEGETAGRPGEAAAAAGGDAEKGGRSSSGGGAMRKRGVAAVREHSFLDNPNVPEEIKVRQLRVTPQ